jgi:hypothetical protein
MKKVLLLALLFALLTAPAYSQTALNVVPGAALNGTNFGLEVTFDSADTSAAYVRDDSPNDETVYRAGFWIDPNSAVLNSGGKGRMTSVFLARGNGAGRILVQLQRFNNSTNTYKIRAACADNTNLTRRRARDPITNAWGIVIQDEPVYVTFESVFAGSQGGECRITANGETQVHDTYQSSFGDVEQAFFGAPRDVAAVNGSIYLDEFESFRTLAPME